MSNRYKAKVIRIFDGDTIEVEIKKGSKRTIRFFGIDTPERTQEFGKEARDRVKELLHQKEVEIFPVELGRYGREVGIVYLNGRCISEILLKEGLAFASGTNHKLSTEYHRFQEISRSKKIGMWKLGFVENPSIYRRRKQSIFKKALIPNNTYKENKVEDNIIKKTHEKDSKGLLQYLKDLIGETYKDITKEDKYMSSEEILKKINIKPKEEVQKDNKGLLQYLKNLIGETYKDLTKEDKYMSSEEILKKINMKPKEIEKEDKYMSSEEILKKIKPKV